MGDVCNVTATGRKVFLWHSAVALIYSWRHTNITPVWDCTWYWEITLFVSDTSSKHPSSTLPRQNQLLLGYWASWHQPASPVYCSVQNYPGHHQVTKLLQQVDAGGSELSEKIKAALPFLVQIICIFSNAQLIVYVDGCRCLHMSIVSTSVLLILVGSVECEQVVTQDGPLRVCTVANPGGSC